MIKIHRTPEHPDGEVVNGVTVIECACEKCNHEWLSNKSEKRCPKCRSSDWHTNVLE